MKRRYPCKQFALMTHKIAKKVMLYYHFSSRISEGFKQHSSGVLDGCIMAIDGLAVRVRQPFKSEVTNTKAWTCRKGGFALIVMAGSDVNGRFHMATANHSGTSVVESFDCLSSLGSTSN